MAKARQRQKSRGSERSDYQAQTGRADARGKAFQPGQVVAMAPGSDVQFNRPRPSPTRYPISHDVFLKIKTAAKTRRVAASAKRSAVVVHDRRRRSPVAAERAAPGEAAPALATAPGGPISVVASFPGISATGWLPPDCTLAVGPRHVVVSVNATVSVYARTGGAPTLTHTLVAWFASVIAPAKLFDPKLLYDQQAGRWVLVALADGPGPTDSFVLISISKTADPNGAWWNYKIDATKDGNKKTNDWADYPSVGLDSQALYLTVNMFQRSGGFTGARLFVIPKTGPYAGGALTFKSFTKLKNGDGSLAFTVQPCHTFGAPGAEFLVNTAFPSSVGTRDYVTLWSVTNPSAPTLTRKTIKVAAYGMPPDADQRGGGTPLDSGDPRVLNAVSRGGAVWCAFVTTHSFGGPPVAAIQWLQLNPTSGTLTQQGVYGANGAHYFYPGVMPNTNGDLLVVFSRSSTTEFASIAATGRRAADPPGTLGGSVPITAGTANYVGLDGSGRNRWGDYAGAGVDPVNNLGAWLYSMYATTGNHWATQIASVV